ncbi:hypothetical protein QUF54_08215 [Candidatus Marithioploca araucensis]|uniref:Transcriptional regulator/antitoxin, MazE n=1 Tax=Candidatus Marithioploca araucensis TaxID=70273 RepID=A0ABT7VUT9_9GAMM|nr:hypothetical protein [Candidatus Marithioploca araucensis]
MLNRITIQKWGNGLGLRITEQLESLHFEAGTVVEVEVTRDDDRLKGFKKKFKNPFSESDLVNELSPYTAHLDELVTPLITEMGEEV